MGAGMGCSPRRYSSNILSFRGRATRTEYWWFLIAYLIGVALTMGCRCWAVKSGFSVFRRSRLPLVSCTLAWPVAFPALLALWVRRCRDLGRLNVEAIVTFLFGCFSASIFSPLASGGVFFEIPALFGKMFDGFS